MIRLGALVFAAVLLAALVNWFSPRRLAWTGREVVALEARVAGAGLKWVSLQQAVEILEAGGHVLLDARPRRDYGRGHIPGAISMPADQAPDVFADLQMLLLPEQPVLVYCSRRDCDDAVRVGQFLREQGVLQVAVLAGGMTAWRAAGLPMQQGQ